MSEPAIQLHPTTLPAALTIATVETLAAEFGKAVSTPPCMTLDASLVETLTTPGVQLLLSLAKSLSHQGIQLRIANARPLMAETFTQLGLTTEFTAWEI